MVYDLETPPEDRDYPSTDILDYYLEEGLPNHKGTNITISLYKNPIGQEYSSIEAMESAIKKQVEFMSTTVNFNGKQLNTPPWTLNWDYEDEHAYYKFSDYLYI